MTELFAASLQWATRPADERFTSLHSLYDYTKSQRDLSRSGVVSSRKLRFVPDEANPLDNLLIEGPTGQKAEITHHAFSQLATRAGSPAEYLRTLPPELAADCLNYGLLMGDVQDTGILLTRNTTLVPVASAPNASATSLTPTTNTTLRAATGPNYGRIWNEEIARTLCRQFGDGLTGDWRVPGEFGKAIVVDKGNTTLYAGDRSMFVFLADEKNRISVSNRRNGQPGTLARGFFVWNSETAHSSLGLAFFLFDYACCNRIVWGAQEYKEIRIRHTSGAPDRWLEEISPALSSYSNSLAGPAEALIASAQQRKIDKVQDFLANRFGKKAAASMDNIHMIEEGRPIETLWDAITGATAFARSIASQPERVGIEREAGQLLQLAA